jgi:2-amino-4-hydroxy-6-hydroxymethyldihydropteridine diphosphokinase
MPSEPTVAYIGVGSNVEPHRNIPRALEALRERAAVTGTSAFYVTPPVNRPEQDDYVNGVWRVETETLPRTFKREVLRAVEDDLERVRSDDPYAPRTIDLDLLLYGDRVMNIPELTLPDPDIRTRPFVAVPLLELAPGLVLPGTGTPLADLARTMDRGGLREDAELTARLRMMVPGAAPSAAPPAAPAPAPAAKPPGRRPAPPPRREAPKKNSLPLAGRDGEGGRRGKHPHPASPVKGEGPKSGVPPTKPTAGSGPGPAFPGIPAPPPVRKIEETPPGDLPSSRGGQASRELLWTREYEQTGGIRLDYTDELPPAVKMFLQFLGPGGQREEYNRVLDIGCGKGRVGLHMARLGFHVTGFDIVDSAVQTFAREAWQRGFGERVSVHTHDAGAPWPAADGETDCAFAVTILDNLITPDEHEHFRRELRRVLRPGGLAVVRSYLPNDGYYGPLLRSSPRQKERVLTDPNNGITFRLYTHEELRAFPGEGFCLRQDRLWRSQSFKYGLIHPRLSAMLIFESGVPQETQVPDLDLAALHPATSIHRASVILKPET